MTKKESKRLTHFFSVAASYVATAAGKPAVFIAAVAVVVVWALSGPVFGYSDTWQLVINTGTIITFLMVFLIQNSQNRDSAAIQVKLDELIRARLASRLDMRPLLAKRQIAKRWCR